MLFPSLLPSIILNPKRTIGILTCAALQAVYRIFVIIA